ncbi:MAG TPA: DUF2203 domain-containing protein [Rubrobacteraceae bacterium]|nr:DUF2203 domain-containing protein [Rubrobacteraceae bacterium]
MEPTYRKLFTVEEANGLLPKLQELLDDLIRHRDALREKAPHLEPILRAAGANGGGRVGSEYGVEAYRLYLAIERIQELGVILKDLDMGLLDFPHEREGRIVFLCWHPPEERVGFWHEIEAGYAGRQPL